MLRWLGAPAAIEFDGVVATNGVEQALQGRVSAGLSGSTGVETEVSAAAARAVPATSSTMAAISSTGTEPSVWTVSPPAEEARWRYAGAAATGAWATLLKGRVIPGPGTSEAAALDAADTSGTSEVALAKAVADGVLMAPSEAARSLLEGTTSVRHEGADGGGRCSRPRSEPPSCDAGAGASAAAMPAAPVLACAASLPPPSVTAVAGSWGTAGAGVRRTAATTRTCGDGLVDEDSDSEMEPTSSLGVAVSPAWRRAVDHRSPWCQQLARRWQASSLTPRRWISDGSERSAAGVAAEGGGASRSMTGGAPAALPVAG